MRKYFIYWLVLGLIVIVGCQKELSFEGSNTPAEGSLQDDVSGDCLPKTVNGTYTAAVALVPANNTITVQVNVTKTGNYTIGTDTVNGYYFRGTGTFTTLGNNNITLRGNGTPFSSGVNNFVVSFDSTTCDIQVTVSSPAVFTLAGAPNACSGATVAGAYAVGVPLTSANTATISVNVTTPGSYTISTVYQGMTFSKTGIFTATGVQSVTLVGSGTPTTAGANVVPITAGSSTCTFTVTVGAQGAGTLGGAPNACTPATVNGIYTAGTALDATNKVDVQINVTTVGVFSVTTNTVDGFSFAYSGNITATGPATITLLGTGTPINAGSQTFTVTLGTSTCTFTVTVAAAPVPDYFPRTTNSNWSYEFDDVATDSLLVKVLSNTLTVNGNPFNIFMQTADASAGFDSSGYYRRSGGDYYEWTNLATYLGFDNEQWAEWVFLKDNQPAATTWYAGPYTNSISGTPVTIRIKYTVMQKDVPITVNSSTGSVTYQNTIVIEEHYELQNGTSWVSLDTVLGYYKDYYSRNIGWIYEEYFDGTTGSTPTNIMEMRRKEVY